MRECMSECRCVLHCFNLKLTWRGFVKWQIPFFALVDLRHHQIVEARCVWIYTHFTWFTHWIFVFNFIRALALNFLFQLFEVYFSNAIDFCCFTSAIVAEHIWWLLFCMRCIWLRAKDKSPVYTNDTHNVVVVAAVAVKNAAHKKFVMSASRKLWLRLPISQAIR